MPISKRVNNFYKECESAQFCWTITSTIPHQDLFKNEVEGKICPVLAIKYSL